MEGSIGSRASSGVRWPCWTSGRRRSSYQRLRPASGRPAARGGVRLGRRAVLAPATSSAWRFGRLMRRGADSARWWPSSPLRLLHRIVDAYVNSLLSRPLKILRAVASPAAGSELPEVSPWSSSSSSPPTKLRRRETSPPVSTRRRDGGVRGVMLNICVAEALLLRRSASEVRRSPLQQPRKAGRGRCASVRA